MEDKTLDALKWIVKILNEVDVPYRIGGGLATNIGLSNQTCWFQQSNNLETKEDFRYF